MPEAATFPRPEIADQWLSSLQDRCANVLDLHLPPREKIPLLEHVLEAARQLKDKNAEEIQVGNLGNAYTYLGDTRKALSIMNKPWRFREIGDRRREGAALNNLGIAHEKLGEEDKAKKYWQYALTVFRAVMLAFGYPSRSCATRVDAMSHPKAYVIFCVIMLPKGIPANFYLPRKKHTEKYADFFYDILKLACAKGV